MDLWKAVWFPSVVCEEEDMNPLVGSGDDGSGLQAQQQTLGFSCSLNLSEWNTNTLCRFTRALWACGHFSATVTYARAVDLRREPRRPGWARRHLNASSQQLRSRNWISLRFYVALL